MLKSTEIKQEFEALQNSLKAKAEAKTEISSEEQTKLAELKSAYEAAIAEEAKKKFVVKGNTKMNEINVKNQIFKAMVKGDAITDEMKASGYFATVGATGQVGVITQTITGTRGGYLVPEEFLNVETNGEGVAIDIPCRTIAVSEPSGKIPTFDISQAAASGKFLYSFDELDSITETNATFGQITYTCVDKAGLVPISRRLLEDAAADVLGMVSTCFGTAARYQKTADVLSAVAGISGITTEYLGSNKTFADKEVFSKIIKAVRKDLKGVNRSNAKIVMCDTDFAKMAAIQMTNGEYYLKQMAYDPTRYQVEGIEVIALDDALFTTTSDNTTTVGGYCFVGNFDKVAYIERKGLEITSDYSAGFAKDALMVKGVKRAVAKVLDTTAFVKIADGAEPSAD